MEGLLPLIVLVVAAIGMSAFKSKSHDVLKDDFPMPDFDADPDHKTVTDTVIADDPYNFASVKVDDNQYNTENMYVEGYQLDYDLSQPAPTLVTKPEGSPMGIYVSQAKILGEDFDLKKAVIYSEVMKPKYLDY